MITSSPSKGPVLSKLKAEEMRLLSQSRCYTLTKISDEQVP